MRAIVFRILGAVIGLVLLTLVTFMLIRLIPGSVEDVLLGTENASEAQLQAVRERYGLNDPLPVQYVTWVGGLVQGDFGESVRTRQPVLDALLEKARPSMELALMALAFALLVAVPLGVIAAVRRNQVADRVATGMALLGMSTPDFVIGLLLIVVATQFIGWFPSFGYVPMSDGLYEWFRHIALPSFALGFALLGLLMRLTRAAVIETLTADHVRTARGKGLGWATVMRRHVLRPSLIPVVTTAGLQFVAAIGGVVVIEFVFSIPGMGRLILDGIRFRDYALIQGATLFIGIIAIVVSLLVDLSYRLLDPRVRL